MKVNSSTTMSYVRYDLSEVIPSESESGGENMISLIVLGVYYYLVANHVR